MNINSEEDIDKENYSIDDLDLIQENRTLLNNLICLKTNYKIDKENYEHQLDSKTFYMNYYRNKSEELEQILKLKDYRIMYLEDRINLMEKKYNELKPKKIKEIKSIKNKVVLNTQEKRIEKSRVECSE